jgi:hypothetical protein
MPARKEERPVALRAPWYRYYKDANSLIPHEKVLLKSRYFIADYSVEDDEDPTVVE